ncbi:MAG: hypothetical protein HFG26_08875 [Provencibacterium sp.]|nr:hypothetical protein [Provencibacterium sp.]
MFTKEQIAFMKSIGLNLDFSHLSEADYVQIEDAVGDRYTAEVQEHESKITPVILLCEGILDKLG